MPDRFGDADKPPCPDLRCGTGGRRKGWVDEDDEGRPVPCLLCKEHLIGYWSEIHDSAGRESDLARKAIENQTD